MDPEEYEGNVDCLTMDKLDAALERCDNKKAAGSDGLSVELYKYGCVLLKSTYCICSTLVANMKKDQQPGHDEYAGNSR